MADAAYKSLPFIFESRGISARAADDTVAATQYLNEANCEELAENAIGSRLGSTLINKSGTTVYPLSGPVHSISKLSGLYAAAWRYAGAAGSLYRRVAAGTGSYTPLSSTMSGSPWSAVSWRPDISSYPYEFFADAAGMKKDNGTLSALQNMGIKQPQYPVQAQAQLPYQIVLDNYVSGLTPYTVSGTPYATVQNMVYTTLASIVSTTGIQEVKVPVVPLTPSNIGLFQLLTIDKGNPNEETVLVMQVTTNGFAANFTKTHALGVSIQNNGFFFEDLAASSTVSVQAKFSDLPCGALPISNWPTNLQQTDYISLWMKIADPSLIQSIQIAFDCGDGSFGDWNEVQSSGDYFYKVIAQGPLQAVLNTAGNNSTDATTAATNALLDDSLNLYGAAAGAIVPLNTGANVWTQVLIQLSDFAGAGRANFSDPTFNWANVNSYKVTATIGATSSNPNDPNVSTDLLFGPLLLFGGFGPDSFAGVAYDWLFTFYNNVDGTESNPCMTMSNIQPPLYTNWVTPRRQPVLLTMTYPTLDPQTTSLRIYRRGGTLGDNYRRVDEVLCTGSPQVYTDTSSDADIQNNDFISFVNDVPVTSSLPVPVNTALGAPIGTDPLIPVNQVVPVYPLSLSNISVGQQVNIGVISPDSNLSTFETVIVLAVEPTYFTAFVQNYHAAGETVAATAAYAQPVTIMALAFNQMWFAGDPNNPNYLYWSAPSNPQAVSSAAYVEVGDPSDPITAIVAFKGNLYVSTQKFWWAVAPGSNANASPTVYPTAAKHGCVASRGWIATEEAIFYQAIDGIRAFAGGASMYLTQDQEFIFQDVGTTPIVQADQSQLSQTRAAYWNNMLFFSYVGMDGKRHRLIYHTQYKRWRNDDVDAQSILLEADTNTLVYGDSNGLVHIDRVGSYDEGNDAGTLVDLPIQMNLQTAYLNQSAPDIQKNYNELTLDANTGGVDVTATLYFNDGESSLVVGTFNTTQRQKVNLNINNGLGYNAYKVSLLLTCATIEQVIIYQAAIRCVFQARTRQSCDSYWLRQGTDSSKICKDFYCEYDSPSPLTGEVYYDQNPTPLFTFTLPASSRQSMRVRFPAVLYRLMRVVITGTEDFQVWEDSNLQVKSVCNGKGYNPMPLTPDQ